MWKLKLETALWEFQNIADHVRGVEKNKQFDEIEELVLKLRQKLLTYVSR